MKYGERYRQTEEEKQKSCDLPDWCYHESTYVPDRWTQILINMENIMAYEMQPGKGTMWRNQSDNPKAPLWSGKIKIPEDAAGSTMQIAAWFNDEFTNNEGQTKKENFSLQLSPPWNPDGQTSGNNSSPKVHTKDDFPF